MYTYNGKLNWFEYAHNECITIVFPSGFALNDPVCAYWQWTKDDSGKEKTNTSKEGIINSITKTSSEYRISFAFKYYSFDGIVGHDFSSLAVTMKDAQGKHSDANLKLRYSSAVKVPSTVVYTGKLDWFNYAKREMVTLVVPAEVANNAPVGLYYQWTVDGAGKEKVNHLIDTTFRTVATSSNGDVTGKFGDGYYTFGVTVKNAGRELLLYMNDASAKHDSKAPYNLKQTDFRSLGTKKALILRFGTGTDQGIFLVRNMLTKHIGFALDDIEMTYFDIDPAKGPKKCTKGQDPPTAKRFKAKFTNLLSSALAGDVRFLYVDAHGTTFPDENGSGEPDDNDEGWFLAETDDGTRKEIVDDDWLAQAIRKNLKSGVNLTILTSSCMGGGMLDTHTATPGILLAGCHETQFNVKALKGMDPWMVAVTTVIKNQVKRKRGVPSYAVLYNEAKKFIKAQLASGQISPKYRGPSPDETKPIPFDQEAYTSNQDPQLIFYSGYIDANEERFLYPFAAPGGGKASGEATRYPKDEYPHDEL